MFHGRKFLNSVPLLLLVNFVSPRWNQCIYTHRKYQVKPRSSPLFLAACAPAIVHRKLFSFVPIKSSESKAKFRQAGNCCKRILKVAKLVDANKTESITSQKRRSRDFGILLIVFSTKVNLLYLPYSVAQRCCFLHLIKQNCLLKAF